MRSSPESLAAQRPLPRSRFAPAVPRAICDVPGLSIRTRKTVPEIVAEVQPSHPVCRTPPGENQEDTGSPGNHTSRWNVLEIGAIRLTQTRDEHLVRAFAAIAAWARSATWNWTAGWSTRPPRPFAPRSARYTPSAPRRSTKSWPVTRPRGARRDWPLQCPPKGPPRHTVLAAPTAVIAAYAAVR